jgi:ketosteroid isomerase-like protein
VCCWRIEFKKVRRAANEALQTGIATLEYVGAATLRRSDMGKSKVGTKSKAATKSRTKSKSVTVVGLKRAIEGRKASALASLYADDAIVQVIDRNNPPSKPRRLKGRGAIAAYFEDVCGRDMTHKVEAGVAVGNRLAFTQSCAYPDGTKVYCSAMIDLKGGKIARQVVVQAWDG